MNNINNTPEKRPGSTEKKKNNTLKIVLVVFASIIASLAIGIGIAYAFVSARLGAGAVPTVQVPQEVFQAPIIERPNIEIIPPEEFEDLDLPEFDFEFIHSEDEYIFERAEISDRIFNVLILGDDARIAQSRQRADAILLLSFNRDTHEINITSFMRDIFVPLTHEGDRWFLLNAVYYEGGPGRLINMMNTLFSLDIQRYVVLRFSDVFVLTDILGGLEIDLREDEAIWLNNIFTRYEPLAPGVNVMNGRQILAYSRMRVVDAAGGFGRTVRQRNVIRALIDRVMVVSSVRELSSLVNFGINYVETNVPLSEILTMGFELWTGGEPAIHELRVPIGNSFEHGRYRGASVLVTDFHSNTIAVHNSIFGNTNNIRFVGFERPYMDGEEPEEDELDEIDEDETWIGDPDALHEDPEEDEDLEEEAEDEQETN
jgi:LCP family protein required for cell wall assembly